MVATCGLVAYYWSDKEPPSFTIAMWTIPHELRAGQTFTIREIYYRSKLCSRHIDHGFSQNDIRTDIVSYGGHQMLSPPDLNWPVVKGLLVTGFDAEAPIDLVRGPAIYVMSNIWVCWWNPITWVSPYRMRITYSVWIKGEDE